MYAHTYTHTYAHTNIHMYVHTYLPTYIYIHTHTHTHTHTCILLLSDTLTFGDIKFMSDRTFSKANLSGFLATESCLKTNNKN